ncbi:MAG: LytTR family transcriptional regulator DNA-binding domain-containing protein [Bacteroidota bacterium]
MKLTAVIVDDVAQARATLKEDLAEYCPDVEIIGEAVGVVTGTKLLKKIQPDVVFLDIQLKDGSGFDILEILGEALAAQVIFTTASDAFAIKAFKFSAVDYLLKPIDPDELMAAVEKVAKANISPKKNYELLLDTVKEKALPQRMALHTLEKIHVTEIADIVRCESSGNYTTFFFKGGQKLLVTKTLKEFDQMLSDHQFARVHQSHLINARQIRAFVKLDGGYLVMHDGSKVPVSLRKKSVVMKLLEDL